jgi:hypothetical protein
VPFRQITKLGAGPDIDYHLLIGRHGNVYRGRPLWTAGDTNTSHSLRGHLLVVALGNLQVQEVSSASSPWGPGGGRVAW